MIKALKSKGVEKMVAQNAYVAKFDVSVGPGHMSFSAGPFYAK